MKTNSKIATAIFAGLAAGAAVWYFMSTEAGKNKLSNFVDDVQDFSNTLKHKAYKTAADVQDKAGQVADYVQNKSHDLKDYAAGKAQQGEKFAKNKAHEAEDYATNIFNNAKDSVNS
ncbi:MAG: YtxH domain-containing protein [Sphingobacteriales bacterium]|nr:MAG: YtxH domain-containing protein [Sphingobacteriales bacterium]